MERTTIEIAGAVIGADCSFGSTREYFRAYLSGKAPDCVFAVTQEDRLREQALLDAEADREGLRRRVFTQPFLERAVIQRKTAAYLLTRGVLLLHGSTVAVDGSAYLFTAKTGVGKSTHTRLWREQFGSRAVMVNDDRTFLLPSGGGYLACGSPWSGKHGLDTNLSVPLAGICLLERGVENRIVPLPEREALPMLLSQAFDPADCGDPAVEALTRALAGAVPLWCMACTKEPEAASAAYEAMRSKNE